jgi:DNA polymerase III subunit chi
MPEVQFHFNVPDRLPYACRLLRKAHRLGTPVSVVGEPALLDRLDRLLWVADAMDFVPHIRVAAEGAVAEHLLATPLWLVDRIAHAPADHAVLLQLADEVPADIERFERILEVVSTEPDEVLAGRRRWRTHQEAGRTITRHDAAAAGRGER